jgi:formylmethanofuran dehydrogenase subunit E
MSAKLFKVKQVDKSVIGSNNDNDMQEKNIHICQRCGKVIRNKDSVLLGMGPTCYQKYLCERCQNKTKKLF